MLKVAKPLIPPFIRYDEVTIGEDRYLVFASNEDLDDLNRVAEQVTATRPQVAYEQTTGRQLVECVMNSTVVGATDEKVVVALMPTVTERQAADWITEVIQRVTGVYHESDSSWLRHTVNP